MSAESDGTYIQTERGRVWSCDTCGHQIDDDHYNDIINHANEHRNALSVPQTPLDSEEKIRRDQDEKIAELARSHGQHWFADIILSAHNPVKPRGRRAKPRQLFVCAEPPAQKFWDEGIVWIDTSGGLNIPHQFDGHRWVPIKFPEGKIHGL